MTDGAATGPWGYKAYKERSLEGEFTASANAIHASQFAFLALMLLVFFKPNPVLGRINVLGGVMHD
ncbi:hypothetical protein, partial [Salmonella enterica]|uniref:hypothetical protein n=1 Tax=Salmonella enterica TaxID=28901 RepID=UPI003F4BA235